MATTSLTRRHFVALAEAVRFLDLEPVQRRHVAEALADACARFNGAFDRGRFLRAATEPTRLDGLCRPDAPKHVRGAVAATLAAIGGAL